MTERYEGPVERVTHISISRVYEVECPECERVIDVVSRYQAAIMARRDHFFTVHKGMRGAT